MAALFISSLLAACAAGVEGDEGDLASLDAAVETPPAQETPLVDAGLILPAFDSGSIVPVIPMSTPPRDSGTTGSVHDAGGTTPRDSGSSTPVQPTPTPTQMDSGSTPTPTPTDSGSHPQTDSGSTGGANMCAAAPSYSTAGTCGKCTCMKCATQVTSCFASSEAATNTSCATVHACAEKNHCAGQACYCGTSITCLIPDGACKAEIETAANASGPLDVQTANDDANSAVARARAVGDCQMANCRSECGL